MIGRALCAVMLLCAASANAQGLPCGDPEELEYTLRWRVPSGEVTGYQVHRGTAPGVYDQVVPAENVVTGSDGIASGTGGTFRNDTSWVVAMSATGPGGTSVLSNEIAVPAKVRACAPPGAFELLEIVVRLRAIEDTLDRLRDALR